MDTTVWFTCGTTAPVMTTGEMATVNVCEGYVMPLWLTAKTNSTASPAEEPCRLTNVTAPWLMSCCVKVPPGGSSSPLSMTAPFWADETAYVHASGSLAPSCAESIPEVRYSTPPCKQKGGSALTCSSNTPTDAWPCPLTLPPKRERERERERERVNLSCEFNHMSAPQRLLPGRASTYLGHGASSVDGWDSSRGGIGVHCKARESPTRCQHLVA